MAKRNNAAYQGALTMSQGSGKKNPNDTRGEPGTTHIPDDVRAAISAMLPGHPTLSDATVRAMVGAPADAHVRLSFEKNYHIHGDDGKPSPLATAQSVKFSMTGPYVPVMRQFNFNEPEQEMGMPLYSQNPGESGASRYLYRDGNGQLTMNNSFFRVLREYQGQGVALPIIAKQAKTLSALGVEDIGAEMAGHPRSRPENGGDIGFKVWPLYGYNTKPGEIKPTLAMAKDKDFRGWFTTRQNIHGGTITPAEKAEREAELNRIRKNQNMTLLELYRTPAGRAYWSMFGGNTTGYIDLHPGSESMRVLQAYYEAKTGKKWSDL